MTTVLIYQSGGRLRKCCLFRRQIMKSAARSEGNYTVAILKIANSVAGKELYSSVS